MSLFEWTTPERRVADRVLPHVPNEIYLYIFEYVAPQSGPLSPEELSQFINLGCVCRLFANVCLPRAFEFTTFSASASCDDLPVGIYSHVPDKNPAVKTAHKSTFCMEITREQPLALALAQTVRVCHITEWKGSWTVDRFAKAYITGMSYMRNLRELSLSKGYIEAEHWRAIAALPSLEQLSFDLCTFLDDTTETKVKVKVPRFQMTTCSGDYQLVADVDVQCLRTLVADFYSLRHISWLSKSTLTELHLYLPLSMTLVHMWCKRELHDILRQAPPSLSALQLFVDIQGGQTENVVEMMFDHTVWKNLSHVRSLALRIHSLTGPDMSAVAVLSSALDGIRSLAELQSFTLEDCSRRTEISTTEAQMIVYDQVEATSGLVHLDLLGKGLRFVDGAWSEVSSSTV